MTFNYIKNLFPHKAKSIDEFIDMIKDNQCTTMTTKVKEKVTILSKEGARYPTKHEYTSARFKAYTPAGGPIIFTKRYEGEDSMIALQNMMCKINRIITEVPYKIDIKIMNSKGDEIPKQHYNLMREILENHYL
ncbi:MAG: hypothetical protein ACP5OA_04660 [Candidatus Woesearchaeota archaeon]